MGVHPKPNPEHPREIGGYEILHTVGSGGMATVYAAMQRQPKRMVALKVIKTGVSSEAAIRRFLREIEILGRLQHPYVAQIYDAGTFDDGSGTAPFFVMEYVPGAKSILEYVAASDLDMRERIRLFVRVCSGVDHGHKNKIIHRDLKPGNILIDRKGEPKVIDFGVARAPRLNLQNDVPTGDLRPIGTFQYMAPEQLMTRPVDLDSRCDVYALGGLLYRLVTARPPLETQGLPVQTVALMIREQMPDPPRSIRPDIRPDLESIIMRALAKERSERYSNAGSLGRDLVRYLNDKPVHAHPGGASYRMGLWMRRHRAAVIASVVAIVLALASGAYIAYDLTRQPDPVVLATPPPPPAPDPEAVTAPGVIPLRAHQTSVTCVSFDASGEMVAIGSHDGAVAVWQIDPPSRLSTATDHDRPVRWVDFVPGGVLTGDDTGRGHLIDPTTGRRDGTFNAACNRVVASVANDDGTLASSCLDLTLRVTPPDGGETQTLRSSTGALYSIGFAPDAAIVAAGSDRGWLYAWDLDEGVNVGQVNAARGRIIAIAVRGTGGEITAITAGGLAINWRPFSGRDPESRFDIGVRPATIVAIDPTGTWSAAAGEGAVRLCELTTGRILEIPITATDAVTSLSVSRDATRVAAGLADGTVLILPRELARDPSAPDDPPSDGEGDTTESSPSGNRPSEGTPRTGGG